MFSEGPELAQKGTTPFKGMVILVSISRAQLYSDALLVQGEREGFGGYFT